MLQEDAWTPLALMEGIVDLGGERSIPQDGLIVKMHTVSCKIYQFVIEANPLKVFCTCALGWEGER